MIALYRSPNLLSHWIAHSEHLGWLLFPAKVNGWSERKPYQGDTRRLSRVSARMGFNTGLPHPEATPIQEITPARVFEQVRARVA